jgi:hypothetical protein
MHPERGLNWTIGAGGAFSATAEGPPTGDNTRGRVCH